MKVFSENGLVSLINEDKAKKLFELSNLLIETNKTTNLTAITDEKEVLLKHFVDSAAIAEFIDDGKSVVDVGCGAGFPSLPIAILRGDLTVTALDSTGKKINFVKHAAEKLDLKNIKAVCARAEDFAVDNRESFDVAVSRAVARLNVLVEITLPLVKTGGCLIAMKSNKGKEEFEEAEQGIFTLGGSLERVKEETLSFNDASITRETYIFKKVRKTPAQYPRKYAQILKKPL
ncbi:MAG: 16S rRNA (guanine(527)-N(7))-methyltransferase RsmG [Clostridia bacterium]|nr:16S rRNA (guanine(527)-N(7))-methyltransferase RsmG [Clostridia bacterium]